jgi:hypothetical protein
MISTIPLIPAKAGTQADSTAVLDAPWIPAVAGMSGRCA